MDYFVKNFLFQLKKVKKKKEKKRDRDPTISTVTNIHTRFYIQIREYPSTRILAAALSLFCCLCMILQFIHISHFVKIARLYPVGSWPSEAR